MPAVKAIEPLLLSALTATMSSVPPLLANTPVLELVNDVGFR